MAEMTSHIAGRGSLANHTARNFRWQICPLFHSQVVIWKDPRNILESMFLQYFRTFWADFSQTYLVYFIL